MSDGVEYLHSTLWEETAEPDNAFAAAACFCHGYDVYGDLLGKASWSEYLYLLLRGNRPTSGQAQLLENLAVALANAGPRDPSINAAMNGGAGGSTHASCLMAALAVGAGQLGGAREVFLCVEYWQQCGADLDQWRERLRHQPDDARVDVWSAPEHPPGFDPHGASCATPVRQTLRALASLSSGSALPWLEKNRCELESRASHPLAFAGVAAAAFFDLGLSADQAEMLYLLLRLPGAAVHALEQEQLGWRKFPFFRDAIVLTDDPGPAIARGSSDE